MPPMHGHQLCSPPLHAAPGGYAASVGLLSPHSYAAHSTPPLSSPRLPSGLPYAPHAGAAQVAAAQALTPNPNPNPEP
eukprot:scaffold129868_cov30-Phaeocystis_antarctica.AAC.1